MQSDQWRIRRILKDRLVPQMTTFEPRTLLRRRLGMIITCSRSPPEPRYFGHIVIGIINTHLNSSFSLSLIIPILSTFSLQALSGATLIPSSCLSLYAFLLIGSDLRLCLAVHACCDIVGSTLIVLGCEEGQDKGRSRECQGHEEYSFCSVSESKSVRLLYSLFNGISEAWHGIIGSRSSKRSNQWCERAGRKPEPCCNRINVGWYCLVETVAECGRVIAREMADTKLRVLPLRPPPCPISSCERRGNVDVVIDTDSTMPIA